MFFAPRFHEFRTSFVQGVFDSCRGPVSHHSPEAQDVTCEAAGALIALQRLEFPEHPVRRLLQRLSQRIQRHPQQPPTRSAGGRKMNVRIRIALEDFEDARQRSQ